MKVALVGGHLGPALALIQELGKRKGVEIFWIGRRVAMERKGVVSLEYQVIPKLGIPFFHLTTGRLQRQLSPRTLPSLAKIPFGFLQAFLLLLRTKPDVIVSFGGYLSLPVVVSGWLLRIPTLVHEQTTTSGLANRIAASFATRVAISFATSAPDFPAEKTVLTGNPVRAEFFQKTGRVEGKRPLVLITGGSQGAQVINQATREALPKLLAKARVFHQTGILDLEKFKELKKKLPSKLARRYQVLANLLPEKMAKVMGEATLVVSRAGANSVSEIAAVGVPAILVPIPWSERGEQEKNAKLLASTGLARILSQERLTGKTLLSEIDYFLKNPPTKEAGKDARRLVKPDAARKLAALVVEIARQK